MPELQHDPRPLPVAAPTAVPSWLPSARHGRLFQHVVHIWRAWMVDGAAADAKRPTTHSAQSPQDDVPDPQHAFTIAVGALSVYERAHGRSQREVLTLLDEALAASQCPGGPVAREHAVRVAIEAYERVD